MKHNNKTVLAMAGLGAAVLALRLWLYIVAVDENNLLRSGHMLSLAIWVVAAGALVLALADALRRKQTGALPEATPLAALGDVLLALAIGVTVFAQGTPVTLLEKLRMVAGCLCVPCLGYAAVCRVKGKPVFFGCFAAVCIFFCVYLVSCYQGWSGNPQLQDYVFAMLTCVAAALFAYQNAALSVGIGSNKIWRACGLLAVCFGIAAVYPGREGLLYGAAAVWTLTGSIEGREN